MDRTEIGRADAAGSYNGTIYCLIAYMFVDAGRIQSIVPGLSGLPIPWGIITALMLLVVFWVQVVSKGGLKGPLVFEDKYVLWILAVGVTAIPFAVWRGGALTGVINFVKTLVLFFVASYSLKVGKDFSKASKGMVASVFIIALASLYLKIGHDTRGVTGSYDPNDLALIMVITLPVVICQAHAATGIWRLCYYGVAAALLLTCLMTASRGGFLGLVILGMYAFSKLKRKVGFALLAIVGMVLMLQFVPDTALERISTIWNPQSDYDRTAGDRTHVWKEGLGIIAKHPVLGVGMGNFEVAEGMTHDYGKWFTAHNSLIQIGGELGIPGMILFVVLLTGSVKRLRSFASVNAPDRGDSEYLHNLALALECSLVGFMVGAFFLSQAYMAYLYFLVGISSALQKSMKAQVEDDDFAETNVRRSSS